MCPYLVQGLSDDPSFADDTNISVELLKNMKIYTIERFHSWQLFSSFLTIHFFDFVTFEKSEKFGSCQPGVRRMNVGHSQVGISWLDGWVLGS